MTLVVDAGNAEDVAEALSRFRTHLPEYASDISAVVSELYALGSSLRDINAAFVPNFLDAADRAIKYDLDRVCRMLDVDLREIFYVLGDLGGVNSVSQTDVWRGVWIEIASHFAQQGTWTLIDSLRSYKSWLVNLARVLERRASGNSQVGNLRDDGQLVSRLRERNLGVAHNDALDLGAPLAKRRSYERILQPRIPLVPRAPRDNLPPMALDNLSFPNNETEPSDLTSSPHQHFHHWARRAFRETSTTPFSKTSEVSRCYGESASPQLRAQLKQEFDQILETSFYSHTELIVQLYCRNRDDRARIACKWSRKSGSSSGLKYSSLPLSDLQFNRLDSILQICIRKAGSSRLELWANLVFPTIERLVIFYCIMLALRAQDQRKPVTDSPDYELAGELEVFAGQIIDDNFLHALRVYRDRDTKAVRLQASVHRGEMKRTPVWTAFITHSLLSPTWLSRQGAGLIHVRELQRHIFSSQYEPQTAAQGEQILRFTTDDDAVAFMHTVDDLAAQSMKPVAPVPPPAPAPIPASMHGQPRGQPQRAAPGQRQAPTMPEQVPPHIHAVNNMPNQPGVHFL